MGSDLSHATSSIDATLSLGAFGQASAITDDVNVWLQGMAWAWSAAAPAQRVSTSGEAVERIWQRATLEAQVAPSRVRTLNTVPMVRHGWSPVTWSGANAWVLADGREPAAEALRSWILEVLRYSHYEGPLEAVALTSQDTDQIAQAVALLEKATPRLVSSTLPVTKLIVVYETPIASWYMSQLPEVLGLSLNSLRGRTLLFLAEHILHECLHEKYNMLRLARPMVDASYDDARAPGVFLPWSPSEGERRVFRPDRLMSTLHVYSHLAALHAEVLRTDAYFDRDEAAHRLQKCYERADYIASSLTWSPVAAQLGRDGVRFVSWLREQALAPALSVADSYGYRIKPFDMPSRPEEEFIEYVLS